MRLKNLNTANKNRERLSNGTIFFSAKVFLSMTFKNMILNILKDGFRINDAQQWYYAVCGRLCQ